MKGFYMYVCRYVSIYRIYIEYIYIYTHIYLFIKGLGLRVL